MNILRAIKIMTVFVIVMITNAVFCFSLPSDWNVQQGSADIQVSDNKMTITASDPTTIINFNSFNVNQNESVVICLPSEDARILNRVTGGSQTEILGKIDCNGMFVLVNEAGIHVGSTGEINAANMILSTRDITNDNFVNGEYVFARMSKETLDRLLVNEGKLTVKEGGFGVLIAAGVDNKGMVVATMGKIMIGGGDGITLHMAGNQLISLAVDMKTAETILDSEGNPITEQVSNNGTLEGSQVILDAESLPGVFEKAINLKGIVKATHIEADADSGSVTIVADEDVEINGDVEAYSVDVKSEKDVTVNKDIVATGGDISLQADSDKDGVGEFTQNAEVIQATGSGDVYLDGSGDMTIKTVKVENGAIKVGTRTEPSAIVGTPHYVRTEGDIEVTEVSSSDGITTLRTQAGDELKYATDGDVTLESENGRIIENMADRVELPANYIELIAREFSVSVNAETLKISNNYGDIVIDETEYISEDVVEMRGEGVGEVSYYTTNNITLESQKGDILTATGVSITGNQVKLSGQRIGSADNPVGINANLTYINRLQGEIDIRSLTGIGTSICIRGPAPTEDPDSWGGVIISNTSDLVIEADEIKINAETALDHTISLYARGDLYINSSVTSAENIILHADYDKNLTGDITYGSVVTAAGVVIKGNEVQLIADRFGEINPIRIDAVTTKIKKMQGSFELSDSRLLTDEYVQVTDSTSTYTNQVQYRHETNLFLDASTINFPGTQTINLYGNMTFNNFYCYVPNKYIYFESGRVFTIEGIWQVHGAFGELTHLYGNVEGQYWYANLKGGFDSIDLYFCAVRDANHVGDFEVPMTCSSEIGNTYNWDANVYWQASSAANWNAAASNWSTGDFPGSGDTVIFNSGSSNAGCSITEAVTVAGITMENGYTGTVTMSADGTFGAGSFAAGTFNAGGNAATFTSITITGGTFRIGGALLSTSIYQTAGSFIADSGAVVTVTGVTVNGGSFNCASGTLDVGTSGVTLKNCSFGAPDSTHLCTVEGAWTIVSDATFLTFTHNSGTVKFDGASANIKGYNLYNDGNDDYATNTTFYHVDISAAGTATKTLTDGFYASGNVSLNSGTLAAGSNGMFVGGNWTQGSGSFNPGTGAVYFTGTGSQNITSNSGTFYTISKTGTGTLTLLDTLKAINVYCSGGTFMASASINATTLNISGGTFNAANGTLDVGTGGVFLLNCRFIAPDSSHFFTVEGPWTVVASENSLTYSHSGGTVTFDGASANIRGYYYYSDTDVTAVSTFNNVVIDATGTKTLTDSFYMAGNLILKAGTLASGAYSMYIAGDWTRTSGSFNPGTGSVFFYGEISHNLTSNNGTFNLLGMSGTGTLTLIDALTANTIYCSNGTLNTGGVSVDVKTALYIYGGTLYVTSSVVTPSLTVTTGTVYATNGTLDVGTGGVSLRNCYFLAPGASGAFTVEGKWDIASDSTYVYFTNNSGTIQFDGASANIEGYYYWSYDEYEYTNVTTFCNVDISSTATKTLTSSFYIQGNLRVNSGTFNASGYDITLATGKSLTNAGTFNMGARTLTVPGDITNSGTFLCSGAAKINLTGNWSNTGTFAPGTGTITLLGSTASTLSGATTFYNFYCTTAGKALYFQSGETFTVSGKWNVVGSSGNNISLLSTASSTWYVNPATWSVNYVTVSYSYNKAAASINPTTWTDNGNNYNWTITGVTIAGSVYSDEGTTSYDSGSMSLSVNGGAASVVNFSGGTYIFSGVNLSDGSIIIVYLNGGATFGSTVSVVSSSGITGFDIYLGRVVVRCDYGSSITNANLATAKISDSNIKYSVTSGTLDVSSENELHIWTGDTFAPGGNVSVTSATCHVAAGAYLTLETNFLLVNTAGTLNIAGTLTVGAGTIDLAGDMNIAGGALISAGAESNIYIGGNWMNTGTFLSGIGRVIFDGTGSISGSSVTTFNNLYLSTTGSVGLTADSIRINGNFELSAAGTFDQGTGEIYLLGNMSRASDFYYTSDGTIHFIGSTIQYYTSDGDSEKQNIGDIQISSSDIDNPTTLRLQSNLVCKDITIDENQTLDVSNGLDGITYQHIITSGNWTNSGTYLFNSPSSDDNCSIVVFGGSVDGSATITTGGTSDGHKFSQVFISEHIITVGAMICVASLNINDTGAFLDMGENCEVADITITQGTICLNGHTLTSDGRFVVCNQSAENQNVYISDGSATGGAICIDGYMALCSLCENEGIPYTLICDLSGFTGNIQVDSGIIFPSSTLGQELFDDPSLSILGSCTLNFGSGTLSIGPHTATSFECAGYAVYVDAAENGSNAINFGAMNITVEGDWFNDSIVDPGTTTIDFTTESTFNYTTHITGAGTHSLNNVIISGTLDAPSTLNILGNWTNNGTFNHNSGTLIFSGDTQLTGGGIFNNVYITGTLDSTNVGFILMGDWNNAGTFISTGSTILASSTGEIVTGGSGAGKTFNLLWFQGSEKTVSGNIGCETLIVGDSDMSFSGNITVNGQFAVVGNSTIELIGNSNVACGALTVNDNEGGSDTVVLATSSTLVPVTLSATNYMLISAETLGNSITLDMTGFSGTINTTGLGLLGDPDGIAGNATVNFGSFCTLNLTGTQVGDATVSVLIRSLTSGQNTVNAGGSTWNISKDWSNYGVFNAGTSTVNFIGESTISGTGTHSFNNVSIGTTATLTSYSGNVNVGGNWTNDGTLIANSGTITFTGTGNISGSTITTFNNLYLTTTGSVGLTADSIQINGTFDLSAAGTFDQGTGEIYLLGNMSKTSAFYYTSDGTIHFIGKTIQLYTSAGDYEKQNIGDIQISSSDIDNPTTLRLKSVMVCNDITIDENQTLDVSNGQDGTTYQHILTSGNWTNSGTYLFNTPDPDLGCSLVVFKGSLEDYVTITTGGTSDGHKFSEVAISAHVKTVGTMICVSALDLNDTGAFLDMGADCEAANVAITQGTICLNGNTLTSDSGWLAYNAGTENYNIYIYDGTTTGGGICINGTMLLVSLYEKDGTPYTLTCDFSGFTGNIEVNGGIVLPSSTLAQELFDDPSLSILGSCTLNFGSGTLSIGPHTATSFECAGYAVYVDAAENGSNAINFGAMNITVEGDWFNDSIVDPGTTTIDFTTESTFNYTTHITGAGTHSLNNVIISGTLDAPSTLNILGNWTNNGTFNHNSGTITFTGTGNISGSMITTFNDLYLTTTGSIALTSETICIAGDYSLSTTGTFNQGSNNINLSGDMTIAAGFYYISSGTIYFCKNGTQIFTDNTDDEGEAVHKQQIGNVNICGDGTTNASTLQLATNMHCASITIGTYQSVNSAAYEGSDFEDIAASGNWMNYGTYVYGTIVGGGSCVKFDDNGVGLTMTITPKGTGDGKNFYYMEIGSGTVNIAGDIKIEKDITIVGDDVMNLMGDATIGGNLVMICGNINASTYSIFTAGWIIELNIISATTLTTSITSAAGSEIYGSCIFVGSLGSETFSAGAVLDLSGYVGTITLTQGIGLAGAGSLGEYIGLVTGNSYGCQGYSDLTLGTSVVLNAGSFALGVSTVDCMNDKSFYCEQAYSNSTFTQHNVVNASASTWTITGDWYNDDTFNEGTFALNINGIVNILGSSAAEFHDITITADGCLVSPSGGLLSVSGNFINYGTFKNNAGTIYFNGTASQSVATNASSFNNLFINNTGDAGSNSVIINGILDVNGAFTLQSGNLDLDTYDPVVYLGGDITVSAGTIVKSSSDAWVTFDGLSNSYNAIANINFGDIVIGDAALDSTTLASDMTCDLLTIISDCTITLNTHSLTVLDDLTINGALVASLTDPEAITVGGDFTNNGTFTSTGSTVTMTGIGKTLIAGDATFYTLNITGDVSAGAGENIVAHELCLNGDGSFTTGSGATFVVYMLTLTTNGSL
ncbi:MAG TPA: filamentous hemagglutinin N-terminal domain-containing protein, partial [Candidatus Omnitrophota bacterium]|nr:filamentous hemagglutinin N-terminal domain-containing protein [Candidatus Omnitrophota bacterium]